MSLLVIEDNPKMAALIRQGLSEQGFAVDVAETGCGGEWMATTSDHEAIILDIMLPDQDGLHTCRQMRLRGVKAPILMLTALSSTADKVNGLDAGADDYLIKPFEFDELIARVRALMRRALPREAALLRFDDLEVDLMRRTVTRAGRKIRLTVKEFMLLEYFMRHPGRILSRADIGDYVWDMRFDSASNVIDVYVSMLRRKLDKSFSTRLIHTVVGAGYMLGIAHPVGMHLAVAQPGA